MKKAVIQFVVVLFLMSAATASGQNVSAGVSIIGGCCGTGPAHIAALRRAVDEVLGS